MSEAAKAAVPSKRLPPGRHGLSRELVRENQRRRLMTAAAESLVEQGYGGITVSGVAKAAGVSTGTLYQRFDDLWACLLAAFEAAADRLCEELEGTCAATADRAAGARAAITDALALLASDPALAHLLSAEPPPQATALRAARLALTERLAVLLRNARGGAGESDGEREARLIGGALALVSMQTRARDATQLEDLAPTLTAILLAH